MKKTILMSACMILSACSNNSDAAKQESSATATAAAADDAAIRKILKDITASKTAAEMAAPFADDAEWIIVGHAPFKGRPAIEKGIAAVLDPAHKLVFDSLDVKEVILLSDHQALAKSVSVYHVETNGKSGPATRNEFADYFVKSANGTWQIAYEINSDENG